MCAHREQEVAPTFLTPSSCNQGFKERPIGILRAGSGKQNLDRANGRGGFGSQTAADPPATPREPLENLTVGTVTASHKTLTLQALSSSLNASTAKRGCLGRGKAFG